MNRAARSIGKTTLWLLLAACFSLGLPLGRAEAQHEILLGAVRGVVETTKGRAVGGFWLILDNPDLGMSYRTDVNPIGRFEFTDIYPGSYVFRISPDSYTIVSPPKIKVEHGMTITVTVVVAPTPGTPDK